MAPARSRLGDVILFAGISLCGVTLTAILAVREYQEYKDAAVADGIVTKLNAGGSLVTEAGLRVRPAVASPRRWS